MGWAVVGIIVFFFAAWWLWSVDDQNDLARCKQQYGQEYTLGHSPANSSIKWCQAPSGEMKAL